MTFIQSVIEQIASGNGGQSFQMLRYHLDDVISLLCLCRSKFFALTMDMVNQTPALNNTKRILFLWMHHLFSIMFYKWFKISIFFNSWSKGCRDVLCVLLACNIVHDMSNFLEKEHLGFHSRP